MITADLQFRTFFFSKKVNVYKRAATPDEDWYKSIIEYLLYKCDRC